MRRGDMTHRRVTWKVSTHRRFEETTCRSREMIGAPEPEVRRVPPKQETRA